MAEDIQKVIEETAKETRRHFDEKTEEVKSQVDEVKNHMDVVAEGLHGDIKAVAEGVELNSQRLEQLEGLPGAVDHIKDDIEVIKTTLDVMKNDLKQKIDRDEFVALEQRVNKLEAKY